MHDDTHDEGRHPEDCSTKFHTIENGVEGAVFTRTQVERTLEAKNTEIARLIRGLEGAKDWAARSGATGLEQWCFEALNPTGKLEVFSPVAPVAPDPRDATIKALTDALEAVREGFGVPVRGGAFGVMGRNIMKKVDAALRLAGRLT